MRVRVAHIFRAELEGFLATHSVPPVVGRAARAIVNCRTAVLGGHAEVCQRGHVRVWYNACRSRCCPRCSFYRVRRWLERQARTLLGCAHHHVIFTVPHDLNPLWLLNQARLGEVLFQAARGALFTLAADPRYLGGVPGALIALHTWGQQLSLHPHVHCLVTAGGVDDKGHWRHCRRQHFLPAEPLKRLFRAKFIDALLALTRTQALRLPDQWSSHDVERLAQRLRFKRWNVHVRERYHNPTAVLNYLGRYLHGGPIGESRLLAFDGSTVSFRYKDYRVGLTKVMSLPAREFIRRYLLHVPPKGFHMVRGYGIYRPTGMSQIHSVLLHQVPPVSAELRQALTAQPNPVTSDSSLQHCLRCDAPIVLYTRLQPRPHARPPTLAA